MLTKNNIHPLIALREKHKEELAVISGYAGSGTNGILKFYTDLTATVYYEIPEKSILYREEGCEDCGREGQLTIYVPAALELKLVWKAKAASFRPSMHPFGDHNPFQPVPGVSAHPAPGFDLTALPNPNPACVERCVRSIGSNSRYFDLLPGSGQGSILYKLNAEGKRALVDCLRHCGYSGPLLAITYQQALARLEGEATYRSDPSMPEIPSFP